MCTQSKYLYLMCVYVHTYIFIYRCVQIRTIPYLQELGKSYPFFCVFPNMNLMQWMCCSHNVFFLWRWRQFLWLFCRLSENLVLKATLFPKCLFSTQISQVNVIVRKRFNFFQWSWGKRQKQLLSPYLNWSWHLYMNARWSFWPFSSWKSKTISLLQSLKMVNP